MRSAQSLLALAFAPIVLTTCQQRPADPALPQIDIAWTLIQPFSAPVNIASVWASSIDDVYVGLVDDSDLRVPVVQHFDGVSWVRVDIPIQDEYNVIPSLWGSGSGDVYVAADGLYHFDGSSWRDLSLSAHWVGGSSMADVFALGERHVFHFDGVSWETLLTAPVDLRSACVASDGALWVAGNDSVRVWDGQAWASIPHPPVPGAELAATSSTDAITWRGSSYYEETEILRWSGSQWQHESTVPGDVNAMIAGDDGVFHAVGRSGLIADYDGITWTPLPRRTSVSLLALSKTQDGAIVFAGNASKVLARAGSQWLVLREMTPSFPNLLWAESPTRLVLDDQYALMALDADEWSEIPVPPAKYVSAIGGVSLDDVFVAMHDGTMFHHDGETLSFSDSLSGAQNVISTTRGGTVYSAGNRSIYRYDGAWTKLLDADANFHAISADEAGHVVAAGERILDEGYVVKTFDGNAWHDLLPPVEYVYAVLLRADGLFLATSRGLYRLVDGRFQRLTPLRSGYTDVFAAGTDVLAFGYNEVAVFDGALTTVAPITNPYRVAQARDGSVIGTFRSGLYAWKP